ncbi:MAG: glycyl radical protein [Candidatus Bathyarchaeia archaeon]
MGLTPRTRRIRDLIVSTKPSICHERAFLITQAYMESGDEPIVVKRARALDRVLTNMSIYINEGELIVGNQASKPKAAPIFPEFGTWMEAQLDDIDKRPVYAFEVSEETKKVLRDRVFPYWRGKTVEELGLSLLDDETKKVFHDENNPIISTLFLRNGVGHIVVDYEKVLRYGFKRIKMDVEEKIKGVDPSDPEDFKKLAFYNSASIVCDAVIKFSKRYSKLAMELSERCEDPVRREELLKIAKICESVPAGPARTFHEALQALWFTHLIIQIESDGLAISPGRMDQYLYPYFKHDVEKGVITEDEAEELIQCLWMKFNEVIKVNEPPKGGAYGGVTMSQMVTLGGINEEGEDATNELSYLFLKVDGDAMMEQPSLCIRVNERTPDELLFKATELLKRGTGKPVFFNDHVIIPALLSLGIPLKEARGYAIVGCEEPTPVGNTYGWTNAAFLNLAKVLELTLKEVKRHPNIGFDALIGKFHEKLSHYVRHMVAMLNAWDLAHQERAPTPYLSLLVDDCIEKGIDITAGGARYNYTGPQGIGLADVVDSLAAIKKVVYEDGAISLEELIKALEENFSGREGLRQALLKAPKYGNDLDEADVYAKELAKRYCMEVGGYRNPRGGLYRPGLYSVAAHASAGANTKALPSGRRAGEPLANNISPVYDLNGPTAAANSAAKIDHYLITNGTALTMTIHPSAARSEEDVRKLISFIRTFFRLGGFGIGMNITTSEMLKDAQRCPERYRGLLVRVSGYSARFVDLPKNLQDEIIRRTEHTL